MAYKSQPYKVHAAQRNVTGSKLKKYQQLIVGKEDILSLLLYEFVMTFIAPVKGMLGIVLRKLFFPVILGKVGKGVVFGSNMSFRHPHKITIGDNCIIDDNCMLDAKGDSNKGITIGNGVFFGRNSVLSCKDGDIVLEDNVNIGFNCDIFSATYVCVGKDTLIAAYSYIMGGGGYDTTPSATPMQERYIVDKDQKLLIGKDCWIGANVKVTAGVHINDGAVIGAGAVVTRDVEKNTIAVGMPAKKVKTR